MEATSPGYSKVTSQAQALRSGGPAPVREALLQARRRTLEIAEAYDNALRGQQLRVPYAPGFNPPLWEWGHVAWFQDWWIARNRQRSLGVACEPAHERAPSQLPGADGWYDSSRVEHRSRWELPLPDAHATREYLAATQAQTLGLLDGLGANPGDQELYFFRLVALHEAMHCEAALYMGRLLGFEVPGAVAGDPRTGDGPASLALPAQRFRLGADGVGFAFDNELGAHEVPLQAFEIDARPVSWARFMPFVQAGGCEPRAGWADAAARDPAAAAVHLSALDAEAWCRWAGRRLPTEVEWECAALQAPGFQWGEVWEWTASSFEPYPGFTPHPYRDYSQPWFGGRRVLRGACRATSPWLAHPRYRNFFEPQRTDIFAGFRSCA